MTELHAGLRRLAQQGKVSIHDRPVLALASDIASKRVSDEGRLERLADGIMEQATRTADRFLRRKTQQ